MATCQATWPETSATQFDDRLINFFESMVTQQKSLEYRLQLELENVLTKQNALEKNLRLESKLTDDRFVKVQAELDFMREISVRPQKQQKQEEYISENSKQKDPWLRVCQPQTRRWDLDGPEPDVSTCTTDVSIAQTKHVETDARAIQGPQMGNWQPDSPEEGWDESTSMSTKGQVSSSGYATSPYDMQLLPAFQKDFAFGAIHAKLDQNPEGPKSFEEIRLTHNRMSKKIDAIERVLLRWRLLDSVSDMEVQTVQSSYDVIVKIETENLIHDQHLYVDEKETQLIMAKFSKTERIVAKQIASPCCAVRCLLKCLRPSENTHECHKRKLRLVHVVVFLLACFVGCFTASLDEVTSRGVSFAVLGSADDVIANDNPTLVWVTRGITLPLCVAWSILELFLLHAIGMFAAVCIVRVRNLALVPLNHDRAEILQGISRAAAQADFSTEEMKGINPLGRMSKAERALLLAKESLRKQRAMVKSAGKFGLKRFLKSPASRRILLMLLSRTSVKVGAYGSYISFVIAAILNMLFDAWNIHHRMGGLQVCCTGPQYISTVLEALFQAHRKASGAQDMDDDMKIICCRALAVAVVSHKSWHPNITFAVNCLETLLTDDVVARASEDIRLRYDVDTEAELPNGSRGLGPNQKEALEDVDQRHAQLVPLRLEDLECFLSVLRALKPADADLVLTLLALGLTVDGTVTQNAKNVMRQSLEAVQPPRNSNPDFLAKFAERIYNDRKPSAEQFLAYVRDPEASSK